MHRVVPTALVLLAILPQACQRDGTTAPQPLRLGAQVAASPPSTKIAFWSSRDGNAEIYVMNEDGSGQTRLTNNPAADYGPSWSPDGRQIAFASDQYAEVQIVVMNADGSDAVRLTQQNPPSFEPSWSPDGQRIAFGFTNDGIDLINVDGTGQTPLGVIGGNPTWSPDGRQIAFEHDGKIYVMNADGSGVTQLTNGPC